MADTHLEAPLRIGETRPIYAAFAADTTTNVAATHTLQPGGWVTLYDAAGAPVLGVTTAPITGIEAGAGALKYAWYTLNTTALSAGPYVLAFTVQAVGSDTITRTEITSVGFELDAAPADFTYSESALAEGADTAAGRLALTRLLISDVVNRADQEHIFSDLEVQAALSLKSENIYLAGAFLLRRYAVSRTRQAQQMSRDGLQVMRWSPEQIEARACSLEQEGLRGELQTGVISTSSPNEYLDSYRPTWRGLTDYVLE